MNVFITSLCLRKIGNRLPTYYILEIVIINDIINHYFCNAFIECDNPLKSQCEEDHSANDGDHKPTNPLHP